MCSLNPVWRCFRRSAVALALLACVSIPAAYAQVPAESAAPVEAWFYLGRQNEAGAWAPQARTLRLGSARDPKRVTVLGDTVLVDNINPAAAGGEGDSAMAEWTRVVRRGPGAITLEELVRQDSIANGKLVWARVRVAADRVEVLRRP